MICERIVPGGYVQQYRNLHLWMIIPMVVMQLGIFVDYWGDFADNDWVVHVHYWAASLWYLFLILQPYLATHGHIAYHRTNGMIGLFLAGGVGVVALGMMHRDMRLANLVEVEPGSIGPFEPWFFYGVAVIEIVMIVAFMFAVIQGVLHRKRLHDHAWWLLSTVFIIMLPALGRGLQAGWIAYYGFDSDIIVMQPLYVSLLLILAMALLAAKLLDRLRHPATALVVGVNLFCFLLEPLGRSPAIQGLLSTAIRG
jgi:hypothetical protein